MAHVVIHAKADYSSILVLMLALFCSLRSCPKLGSARWVSRIQHMDTQLHIAVAANSSVTKIHQVLPKDKPGRKGNRNK